MASTASTFDAFLKERYTNEQIDALTYEDRPLFDMVEKDASGSGDLFVHPVIYSNPQGLGATLAKAQAGAQQSGGGGNLKGKKWTSEWGDYDASIEIGSKVLMMSRDDVGSFLRNQAAEIDRLYEAFADVMGYYIYADGGRAIASGTINTGVVTLTNADDIVNIEVGQILVASANDGTSSAHTLLGSGAAGYVIAVNRNAGTFTVSATAGGSAGTPSGWTSTMYFFRDGDFGGSGATTIFDGLGAWIPASDPSSTAFHNVDRTADITRLSGVRLTASEIASLGTEQRIKKLVTRMKGRAGGRGPTHVMVNPEKWQNLADSLEARGTRPIEGKATFNYSAIRMAMGGQNVEIVADRFCPVNTAFAVRPKDIKIRSLDKFPHVVNGDGLTMLRKTTSSDYEFRLEAFPALIIPAPGWFGRVSLA